MYFWKNYESQMTKLSFLSWPCSIQKIFRKAHRPIILFTPIPRWGVVILQSYWMDRWKALLSWCRILGQPNHCWKREFIYLFFKFIGAKVLFVSLMDPYLTVALVCVCVLTSLYTLLSQSAQMCSSHSVIPLYTHTDTHTIRYARVQ